MSKGTASLLGLLAVITTTVVLIGGLLSVALGGADGTGESAGHSFWFTLMHTINTGVLAKEEGTPAYLLVMTIVTLTGMFITSFLIATISSGIKDKVANLRRGKSLVIEEGHTVIIGFDENIGNIIEELVLANENQREAVAVVMAEHDKVKMEEAISDKVPNTGNLRVVCRSGRPDSVTDLKICSLDTCKSIIVNLDDDFMTVKTILACKNLLDEYGNQDAFITATVRNREALHPAQIAGGDRAEILNFQKTIARLIVQSGRHPGISLVLSELLSFEGQEIYVGEEPSMEGLTLQEINLRLPECTAIGLVRDDLPQLNPDQAERLRPGDQLIWIAEDDFPLQLQESASADERAFANRPLSEEEPHTLLILGYTDMLKHILVEVNEFAATGSKVIIAAEEEIDKVALLEQEELKNIEIDVRQCEIYKRSVLEELVADAPSSIVLMADPEFEKEDADARTLMLQLQLTDIKEEIGADIPLIIEMNSTRNQHLSQMMRATDFVVSSSIIAKMMVQIAEHRHKKAILNDLISEDGSTIYMKPIRRYVNTEKPVNFYTLGASAARFNETAIGYKKFGEDNTFTIEINPLSHEKKQFDDQDDLIVIAMH